MKRKIVFGFLAGVLLCCILTVYFKRHALACEFIPMFSKEQLVSRVFVTDNVSKQQKEDIKQFLPEAYNRISQLYGSPESLPKFLFTASVEEANSWGANETASMHRLPWGSCVVVGPKGHNVDVVAHEWLHAEAQHRVGFFRFIKEVPIWFDEGAALTVDFRAPYLPENIGLPDNEIVRVRSIEHAKDFFSDNAVLNYQAARLAVIPLIDRNNFYNHLDSVASGSSFEDVFAVKKEKLTNNGVHP